MLPPHARAQGPDATSRCGTQIGPNRLPLSQTQQISPRVPLQRQSTLEKTRAGEITAITPENSPRGHDRRRPDSARGLVVLLTNCTDPTPYRAPGLPISAVGLGAPHPSSPHLHLPSHSRTSKTFRRAATRALCFPPDTFSRQRRSPPLRTSKRCFSPSHTSFTCRRSASKPKRPSPTSLKRARIRRRRRLLPAPLVACRRCMPSCEHDSIRHRSIISAPEAERHPVPSRTVPLGGSLELTDHTPVEPTPLRIGANGQVGVPPGDRAT